MKEVCPDRKINILHTVLSLEMGGLEKVVADTVTGMNKQVFNVEVCCFDELGHFAAQLPEKGVKVSLLGRRSTGYDALLPLKLGKMLDRKKIDILHMHSGTFFLGSQAALLAGGKKTVYTDHGRHLIEPRLLPAMDRFSGFFAKKIVAVSKELEKYLVEVIRLPAHKTTTIINGIDTGVFRKRQKSERLLKELGIPAKNQIVGSVGRLAPVKDQASMIEAFSIIGRDRPDLTLLIVGDGPLMAELQKLAEEKGVRERVVFTGKRSDIPDLMSLFDIFILTSLSEGTSISLLEAMASGATPVVTDVGGNPSIVTHDVNGLLIQPKDLPRLAGTLGFLLDHEQARLHYAEKAVQTVRECYSLEKMIERYTGVYLELVQ